MHWKELFSFSSGERKGILVLAFLMIGVNGFRYLAPYLFPAPAEDFSEFEKTLAQIHWVVDTPERRPHAYSYDSSGSKKERASIPPVDAELFAFDPNTLPDSGWLRLGLRPFEFRMIGNYVRKGGQFRKKDDLRKMHCITDSMYSRFHPFIQLPDSLPPRPSFPTIANKMDQTSKFAPKKKVLVELNTADSLTLLDVRGVGPWTASKIIRYRERLGGFIRKEQLLEIRGLDSGRYDSLAPQFLVDIFEVNKMNVNTASLADLGKHPYLGYANAKILVAYRQSHGAFNSVADLKKLVFVDEELYSKLAPYIQVKDD